MGELPSPSHSPLNIGLILLTVLTFVITATFNALAGSGAVVGEGKIFSATVGDISDIYQLYITPAGFTFSIWSIIYLWIAFSLFIFVVTIFIKTDFGR